MKADHPVEKNPPPGKENKKLLSLQGIHLVHHFRP